MKNTPRCIYFDLGNVIFAFSHEQAAWHMARVAGISFSAVWQTVFGKHALEIAYERGEITSAQFHQRFCELTNTSPSLEALLEAGSTIFTPLQANIELAQRLRAGGHRLGVLSNTCEAHWQYCRRTYASTMQLFELSCLSYEVKSLKPDPAIYERAIELANVPANEIFFFDDRPENVAGALMAGIDAVLFTSAAQLKHDLRQRGVET